MENDPVMTYKDGCKEPFSRIHKRHFENICRLASSIAGASAAERIVQESFDQLLSNSQVFQNGDHLQNYLYTTVHHACVAHMERRKEEGNIRTQLISWCQENALQDRPVLTSLPNWVEAELEILSPQCRSIFNIAFIDGLSNDEIADRLGISHGDVANQKMIALKLLRDVFLDKHPSTNQTFFCCYLSTGAHHQPALRPNEWSSHLQP